MRTSSKTTFEIILVVSVVIAFAVVPLVAKAGEHKGHGPVPFAEFDTDRSGFVSEEEFNTARDAHMAAMAEAGRQMKGAATAPSFADFDTDDDAQLSEDEMNAGHKAHMKAMRAENKGKHRCKNHGKHHGKHKQKKAQKEPMKMPTFEDIDTDGDGAISPEEFAAHQASHHGENH